MTIYRGQHIGGEEIVFIRQFIADHPELSRWKLSRQLCEAWQWKQANGALRDMVCRGLLLMLDRAGEIQLPPVRRRVRNRLAERERPEPVIPDNRPLRGPLRSLTPLEFVPVRRTSEEPLFNSLMEQYHYLGYEQPVGEHLKYLVKADGQAIACLAWSSAPRHLGCRDRYIGWSDGSAAAQHAFAGLQHSLSDSAVGARGASGFAHSGPDGEAGSTRLAAAVCPSDLLAGNFHRSGALSWDVLSRGQLASAGARRPAADTRADHASPHGQ